jgi:methionyl-tRNA formyltransferase
MKKIVFLSTDTLHHLFFLNYLLKNNIELACCMFETTSVSPPFAVGPLFEEEENRFEETHFLVEKAKLLRDEFVFCFDSVNSDQSFERLAEIKPDFGVVFGTRKINSRVIEIFKDGLINVHRGISQEYRGLDSDLWAIYHSDYDNLGVTIHMVDPTLDVGDIVYQQRLVLKRDIKIFQLRYYTTLIATELVTQALRDYLNCEMRRKPQEKMGRYYSFMPLVLKKWVNRKYNKYCNDING